MGGNACVYLRIEIFRQTYLGGFKGGVYIAGLDLLLTSICFSVLGYGLCYLTLSSNNKLKTHSDNSENHWKEEDIAIL